MQVLINKTQQRGRTAAILLTVTVIPTKKTCILKVWSSACVAAWLSCWSFPEAQELEAAGHTKKAVAEYLTVVQGSADALTTLARTHDQVESEGEIGEEKFCEKSR